MSAGFFPQWSRFCYRFNVLALWLTAWFDTRQPEARLVQSGREPNMRQFLVEFDFSVSRSCEDLRVHEATLSSGRTMRFVNHVCRRCSRRMQEVANIDTNGSTPGLVAFLCVGCGSTHSVLVHPINGRRGASRSSTQNTVEVVPLPGATSQFA